MKFFYDNCLFSLPFSSNGFNNHKDIPRQDHTIKPVDTSHSQHDHHSIEEIAPYCDKFCCYRKCRLEMVGGGRCHTKVGCICYESFFVENSNNPFLEGQPINFGEPTSVIVPEDRIWYQLSTSETNQIKNATLRHFAQPNATQHMCEKE